MSVSDRFLESQYQRIDQISTNIERLFYLQAQCKSEEQKQGPCLSFCSPEVECKTEKIQLESKLLQDKDALKSIFKLLERERDFLYKRLIKKPTKDFQIIVNELGEEVALNSDISGWVRIRENIIKISQILDQITEYLKIYHNVVFCV